MIARTFNSGYWIKPVYGKDGKIEGTHILYASSMELGGSVPQVVLNTFGPQSAIDCVEGLIKYVQKN